MQNASLSVHPRADAGVNSRPVADEEIPPRVNALPFRSATTRRNSGAQPPCNPRSNA